jgi:hypothetical protein
MLPKKNTLDELKSKGLIYDEDKNALSKKLLEKELKEASKKDSVIERILRQMRNKGLSYLPGLSVFLSIF